jgi:hypothetical protein
LLRRSGTRCVGIERESQQPSECRIGFDVPAFGVSRDRQPDRCQLEQRFEFGDPALQLFIQTSDVRFIVAGES